MYENLYKYALVAFFSMFKFILGPLTGAGIGLNWFETAFFTFVGMMLSVVIVTFLGISLRKAYQRHFQKNKKIFSKRTRFAIKTWRQYGIYGTAFLTPLIFTPIGGTLIAVSFGEKKNKIIFYMLISAVFWGIVLSALVSIVGASFFQKIGF